MVQVPARGVCAWLLCRNNAILNITVYTPPQWAHAWHPRLTLLLPDAHRLPAAASATGPGGASSSSWLWRTDGRQPHKGHRGMLVCSTYAANDLRIQRQRRVAAALCGPDTVDVLRRRTCVYHHRRAGVTAAAAAGPLAWRRPMLECGGLPTHLSSVRARPRRSPTSKEKLGRSG